jgi:hypothetical protein
MFSRQGQLGAFAAQVEVGVTPAVQFTGTAQGLPWAAGVGVFARVMNQDHSHLKLTLQFSKVRKQRGDLGGIVFIDAMESDQGIQDQKNGLEILHGVSQALAIDRGIQPERGRGDDFDGQRWKAHSSGAGDAFQALAHDSQRVLGGKEQHFAGAAHGELPQAGGARSDAHRHIEGQEAFAAFGFSAENADGLIGPEPLD